MSQPPVSPIPPIGPRSPQSQGSPTSPGPDPGPDPELHAAIRELRENVVAQRSEVAFLRNRAGWILAWSFLAMMGSCGTAGDAATDQSVSDLRQDIQQLQSTVQDLRSENQELRESIPQEPPAPRA